MINSFDVDKGTILSCYYIHSVEVWVAIATYVKLMCYSKTNLAIYVNKKAKMQMAWLLYIIDMYIHTYIQTV